MNRDKEISEFLNSAVGATAGDAPLDAVTPPVSSGATMSLGGAYEGATRLSRNMQSWMPANRSADMDILPQKKMADARSKDVLRNDPIIQSGGMIHKDTIVGSSYTLNCRPNYKFLGLDEVWEEEFADEVESLFSLWADSDQNWVDASRQNDLTGMVRLAVGVDLMCGEVLASVEWLRDGGRPFSTALQMIDIDRLSNPIGYIDNYKTRGGVIRNKYGAPQAYNIRMAHPSDYGNPDSYMWKTVPIRKPWGRLQMMHLFEQARPDQTRGISDLVAGLKDMKMLKDFRAMVLENAIVNATYAASIESELPTAQALASVGVSNSEEDAMQQYLGNYLSAIDAYSGKGNNLKIDGVKIPHLFPGTKLQLRPAGTGGPLGTEFEMSCHRYLAATLGVSYEELMRDYTNTNLSSAKAAFGNTEKRMRARKKYTADKTASAIFKLWFEEAVNAGLLSTMKNSKVRSIYTGNSLGLDFEAFTLCSWMGSGAASLDPLKDTQAAALGLKSGITTLADESAKRGRDWRKDIKQRGLERKMLLEYGLDPLIQDPSLNAASGSPQTRQPGSKQQDDGTSTRTPKQ